jgi:hypothetical protein
MLPNDDQIRQAAYGLWQRRGRVHGYDRQDWDMAERALTFSMNYETIAEYSLDSPGMLVLSERPTRYCRFCERTSAHTSFGAPRAVVQGIGHTSLFSEAICDACQASCRDGLIGQFERCWSALRAEDAGTGGGSDFPARDLYSIAVLKSLSASALLIMPEDELTYFVDTLEWVNNPYHDDDRKLFAGMACHVYAAPFLSGRSWCSLSRRIDDGLPLPYMIYFLSHRGMVLQVQVPLSVRDQDSDGRMVPMPERSFVTGEHCRLREVRAIVLRLGTPIPGRSRPA